MPDVLFIKTSSLGDVIHHMPAVTEAKARRPQDRFTWVVEEAIAPLVRLHPAIDEVIPVATRRWRRRRLLEPSTWSQIAQFWRRLRARRYETIVDTQGLIKSAAIARAARGRRHGYDSRSLREPQAAWLYDVRYPVGRNQHAVVRNRMLTGLALGYAPQDTSDYAPDYGLDRLRLIAGERRAPYGVLLHATAKAGKEWPVEHWRGVASELAGDFELVLPWGNEAERERAELIAQGVAGARVPELRPLDDVARLIAGASFAVGVDTGLTHLAAALGVPLVAIFSASEPRLTGPIGSGPIAVLGAKAAPPDAHDVIRAVRQITA